MSVKTILITRARGDGDELRHELQSLGHRVIHEPLTEIFLNHTARPELQHLLLEEPDAVIVTSRYGARALAALDETRDLALLCVGESTADVAQSLGFSRVAATGATVEELAGYVIDAYDPGARFIYASARHVRADLDTLFSGYDFDVRRVVLYEAVAAEALSDTLIEQLRRGQIDAAAFLSQRSAEIFTRLIEKAGAADTISQLYALCLSDAVAAPLSAAAWKAVTVCDEPTLASLVASVDNA